MKTFQFTHPGRGATQMTFIFDTTKIMFQFTHPGRGATGIPKGIDITGKVSIHAPREGCDYPLSWCHKPPLCFNSRTPGGVRQNISKPAEVQAMFQFTHPGRGATDFDDLRRRSFDVSIHAPREGCDWIVSSLSALMEAFQFTHPGRGATRPPYPPPPGGSFNSRTPGGVRLGGEG